MNEYAGVSEWTGGIPVELPIDAVRRYVQGETLTPERFDLLQDYFEGRIIKLLENDLCGKGNPALSDDMDCEHDEQTKHLIALIKENNE